MQRDSGWSPGQTYFDLLKIGAILLVVCFFVASSSLWSQRAQPTNCVGGTLNAPIRLDVFSDFQCPACREFYIDVIAPAVKEYGRQGKICVLYHELPLKSHQYSHKAAAYSLAAQRIGRKQWLAVMDRLYRTQALWALDGNIDGALESVVSAADLERIRKIAAEPSINSAIERAIEQGDKREVESTPTVFVTTGNNTQKVDRILPYQVWKDFIENIIK
jgi:protein-disulfide isomerase